MKVESLWREQASYMLECHKGSDMLTKHITVIAEFLTHPFNTIVTGPVLHVIERVKFYRWTTRAGLITVRLEIGTKRGPRR